MGRPAGIAFDVDDEHLIIIDTARGVYQLNINNGKKKLLISTDLVIQSADNDIPPRKSKFFLSVDVAKNGDIFFTSASDDFGFDKGTSAFFPNPSGRLMHYSKQTSRITTLVDRIFFANGVCLSPNEDFVLVADLGRSRILKHWIKSEKNGKTEIFADGIPGVPDNLSCDKNGVWTALPVAVDPENPLILHQLAQFPLIRKFIVRSLKLLELLFSFIDSSIYENDLCKTISYHLGGNIMSEIGKNKRSSILRFDWNGSIVAAYHAFDGSTYTHVLDHDGKLYLGSFKNDYIAIIKRQKHL